MSKCKLNNLFCAGCGFSQFWPKPFSEAWLEKTAVEAGLYL